MFASLAIFAILAADPAVPSAPEQGIILTSAYDDERTFSVEGQRVVTCRVARKGDTCFFPLGPGLKTVKVDGNRVSIRVPRGVTHFVFRHVGWQLAGGGAGLLLGSPFSGAASGIFILGLVIASPLAIVIASFVGGILYVAGIAAGVVGALMIFIDLVSPHDFLDIQHPEAPSPPPLPPPDPSSEPAPVPAS